VPQEEVRKYSDLQLARPDLFVVRGININIFYVFVQVTVIQPIGSRNNKNLLNIDQ
jgi:hypothetical protein